MTISDAKICNMALGKLGERKTISTLTDKDSETARTCNLHYEHIRDTLLEAHPWNFAASRATLSQNATDPLFEFDSSFQLPADCLRVLSVYNNSSDYEIEGKDLLISSDSVSIKYISKLTNPVKFSSLFVEAFATRLAAEMADQLTNSKARRLSLLKEFEIKFTEAKRRDSQEGQRGRTTSRGPSGHFKIKPTL